MFFKPLLKFFFVLLTAVFFLFNFLSSTCASENSSTPGNLNREVIIERDVSNTAPVWCGSKHAFFYSNDKGTFLYDIPKKSRTKVSGYGGRPLGCTPDGEWYIYMDKARVRYDKKDKSKGVVDIWRLKLGTNTRQKIAILYDNIYGEIISPQGKTVLVGKQPNSRTAMPEPQWDTYISDNEWLPGNARWFRDASGAAATYQGKIAVELFSPERRTILFDPFLGEMDLRLIRVDNRNRAYVLARKKGYQRKTNLFGCGLDFKTGSASCAVLFQNTDSIRDYDISLDGTSIYFMADQDRCIRSLDVTAGTVKCATSGPGREMSLSPDGKYLAFVRYEKKGRAGRGKFPADVFANDLLLLKIKD